MAEIKNILFPVDFTESSQKVLPTVKAVARQLGANITLLHVVRGPEDFAGFEIGTLWWTNLQKEIMEGAEKAMERFVEENMAEIENMPRKVLIGDVVEEIVKFASDNQIDMIMIGTHGRKGLEKAVFGSVAEGVVANACCPVLTINPFRVCEF